jgi:TetR/AcrR family transcriptional regulator
MSQGETEKISTILEAARKRFAHYGLAKTTMSEIASDIGMSKASLYYYFPDKEHLFVAVISREMDKFLAEMEIVAGGSEKASAKLNQYVQRRANYFRELINLWQVTDPHHESLKPAFSKFHDQFGKRERKLVENILQLGIDSLEFAPMDAVAHADLFVSGLQGFRTLMVKQRDSFLLTPEDYAQLNAYQTLFTTLFVKGISNN